MKKNYKVEVLKNLATINISGVDKKSLDNEISIKLCNYTDVYNSWAITKYKSLFFMNATATQNEIDKFILKKGMVAITKDSEKKDDIGISTYIADDFENVILGYHNALIKPNHDKLNGSFLNAYLHTSFVRKYFSNNASGSGQRFTLSPNRINKLQIYLPSIKTQNYIGKLFSRIDKQIELNNLIYSELEKMAKTLYNYWFVQFDFPDENGRPYKSSGGKMVWSEELQREIPYGWEVKNIKDILNVITGKEDVNFTSENGQYPFFSCSKQTFKCNEYAYDGHAILIAGNGDFNVKAYVGKFNAYQRTYILIPENHIYFSIIYHNASKMIDKFKIGANGAIVKFIKKKDVENIPLLLPNNNTLLSELNNILYMQLKILSNNQELISLRDFLLPLLMNGQAVIKE